MDFIWFGHHNFRRRKAHYLECFLSPFFLPPQLLLFEMFNVSIKLIPGSISSAELRFGATAPPKLAVWSKPVPIVSSVTISRPMFIIPVISITAARTTSFIITFIFTSSPKLFLLPTVRHSMQLIPKGPGFRCRT